MTFGIAIQVEHQGCPVPLEVREMVHGGYVLWTRCKFQGALRAIPPPAGEALLGARSAYLLQYVRSSIAEFPVYFTKVPNTSFDSARLILSVHYLSTISYIDYAAGFE